jgi:hypothetical protein
MDYQICEDSQFSTLNFESKLPLTRNYLHSRWPTSISPKNRTAKPLWLSFIFSALFSTPNCLSVGVRHTRNRRIKSEQPQTVTHRTGLGETALRSHHVSSKPNTKNRKKENNENHLISPKSVSPFWGETSTQTDFSFKFESWQLRGG